MNSDGSDFFASAPLISRGEVLGQQDLIPSARGVYAWYFRETPPSVPVAGCHTRDGLTLLYVGISPKNPQSRQNLRKRVSYQC